MAYVCAPLFGTVTSNQACLCRDSVYTECPDGCPTPEQCPPDNRCHHWPCQNWGGAYPGPLDVGAAPGTRVWFDADSSVQSIRIAPVAICPGYSGGSTEAVEVVLYASPNGYGEIGRVLYGHVTQRNPNLMNTLQNRDYYGSWFNLPELGVVAEAGPCSSGGHVHMDRQGGSGSSLCCGASTTYSTQVYQW